MAFVVNAISFLASAWLILPMTLRTQTVKEKEATLDPAHKCSYRTLRSVFREAPIVPLILALSLLWPIGGGIVNVLISVYAYQVFDAGKEGIGLLYGAIGAGFLLGGVLASRFHQRAVFLASISIAAEGLAHVFASFAPAIAVVAVFFSLSTIAGGFGNACLATLLMQNVPARFHEECLLWNTRVRVW